MTNDLDQLRRHYARARRREREEMWLRRAGIAFGILWYAAVLAVGFGLGRCTGHP